jgi:hypothetical protein
MSQPNPFLSPDLPDYLDTFYFPFLLHQKRLLWGEVGTGKTLYTALFLYYLRFIEEIPPYDITIADFGPTRVMKGQKTIGGKLTDFFPEFNYPHIPIKPPRMTATNTNEVLQACCQNCLNSIPIITNFNQNPTPVLIINDVTIYLHMGGYHTLLKAINAADTVLINGYGGNILLADYQSGISARECRMMKLLRKSFINLQTTAEFAQIMQNLFLKLKTSIS